MRTRSPAGPLTRVHADPLTRVRVCMLLIITATSPRYCNGGNGNCDIKMWVR